LKKDKATQSGETNYPGDLIDPTPFMVYPHLEKEVRNTLGMPEQDQQTENYPWTRFCLVGVAAREGGAMQDGDFEVIAQSKVEAVKFNQDTTNQTIKRLREISPEIFLLAQIVHLPDGTDWSAQSWLDAMGQNIERLYRENVRYFEIQRLPNIKQFGWSRFWHSGEGFGAWWLEVYQKLHGEYPEARFGFPGVLPGGQVPGQRLDAQVFLDGADTVMQAADWLGAVCYWDDEPGRASQEGGRFYQQLRERYPEKLLFISEFGNTNQKTVASLKGQEYLSYYQSLREVPGIGAAFAQVVSAANGYDALIWRAEDAESSGIAIEVGKRDF
jgi:hypothetical protein